MASSTQSGVPTLSSAEAELKAAIFGEKEARALNSLLDFLCSPVQSTRLWTGSNASKSFL
jgi:hypothetical protein